MTVESILERLDGLEIPNAHGVHFDAWEAWDMPRRLAFNGALEFVAEALADPERDPCLRHLTDEQRDMIAFLAGHAAERVAALPEFRAVVQAVPR